MLDESTVGVRYRVPPSVISDIVDAPPVPALSFSPLRDRIIFLKRRALPPLAEIARPEEKLAGIIVGLMVNGDGLKILYDNCIAPQN